MRPYKVFFLWFSALSAALAISDAQFYPSGLLDSYEQKARPSVESLDSAVGGFFKTYFSQMPEGFSWKEQRTLEDATHIHKRYQLWVRERKVAAHFLDIHFEKSGFVQYAKSLWQAPFQFQEPAITLRASLLKSLKKKFLTTGKGKLDFEPVVVAKDGIGIPALDVFVHGVPRKAPQQILLDETTGTILETKTPIRRLASKAWPISPYDGGSNALAPQDVTLSDLTDNTMLSSAFLHVVRMQSVATPTEVEVNPSISTIEAAGITTNPATYSYTCSGGTTACINQRADAVNVYYHISEYRLRLQSYFSTLGVTSPMESNEPLHVIVNNLSTDLDGDGSVPDSNNAAYISQGCTDDHSRCLSFFRPVAISDSRCGGTAAFYDLAREAPVVVHEYQHFVTDQITGMLGGGSKPNVGDALHEGYSDYFGVSQVSGMAGADTTVVGEYAFQECPYFEREIGVARVYQDIAAEADPHISGQSWATGLWQLRKLLGREKTDLIALKSLYFLSPLPGFIEAIEALVKADAALYNGDNAATIRSLFYNDIHFAGGKTDIFRDPAKGIVEVGFRSCSSVHQSGAGSNRATLALMLVWIGLTLLLGFRVRSAV